MRRFLILMAFLGLVPSTYAQKIVKVVAEYTYVAPNNVSPEQAGKTAFERARLTALADEFGTTISQSNSTVVTNENGDSSVDFLSLSSSEVRGEWIETIKEEVVSASYDMEEGMFIITVKVEGRAREISKSRIDVVAKVLCNGTEPRFESDSFFQNDDLYLYFHSPASGHVAVYLSDESQNTYCLLPYMNDSDGKVEVKANKDYVFFSSDKADEKERPIVDEYTMTCDKPVEYNQIFIIYSPNAFVKANDYVAADDDLGLPRQLTYADFQKWLAKIRSADNDMILLQKSIKISRQQ